MITKEKSSLNASLFCGDCLDIMRDIPDKSVDLIITDPPYLMNYKSNHSKKKDYRFSRPILGDNNEDLIRSYIKECYRILKDNSACYIFCNTNKVEIFKSELQKYFKVKNMIVWEKDNHTAGDLIAQYGKKYEIIFYVNKGRCPIRGKRLSDVWRFNRVPVNNMVHQNQKPIELLEQCIIKSSDPGAIVFDGFMGSGSTGVACMNTGRNFIGIELDPKYFDIASKRIEEDKNDNKG